RLALRRPPLGVSSQLLADRRKRHRPARNAVPKALPELDDTWAIFRERHDRGRHDPRVPPAIRLGAECLERLDPAAPELLGNRDRPRPDQRKRSPERPADGLGLPPCLAVRPCSPASGSPP